MRVTITMMVVAGSGPGLEEITEVSRNAVKSPGASGVPRLILLTGQQAGRKFPVGSEMTLGRGSQATLFLDDKRLSRIHARIFQDGMGHYAGWLLGHQRVGYRFVPR